MRRLVRPVLWIGLIIAIGVAISVSTNRTNAPLIVLQAPAASYESFVQLPKEQRWAYWQTATPEAKSQLTQAHATAWVIANQRTLSLAQVASLREAIASITPALAGNSESPNGVAQLAALERKLLCTVWKSQVVQAFQPLGEPVHVGLVDNVSTWLRGCHLAI